MLAGGLVRSTGLGLRSQRRVNIATGERTLPEQVLPFRRGSLRDLKRGLQLRRVQLRLLQFFGNRSVRHRREVRLCGSDSALAVERAALQIEIVQREQ